MPAVPEATGVPNAPLAPPAIGVPESGKVAKLAVQSSKGVRVPLLNTQGLSVVVSGAVLIVLLLRAEKGDLPKIAEILFGSNTFAAVGWTLAAGITIGSIFLVRFLLSRHDREIERICGERNELQKILIERSK